MLKFWIIILSVGLINPPSCNTVKPNKYNPSKHIMYISKDSSSIWIDCAIPPTEKERLLLRRLDSISGWERSKRTGGMLEF